MVYQQGRAEPWINRLFEQQAITAGVASVNIDNAADDRLDRRYLGVQVQFSSLYFGKIQNVVNDTQQCLARFAHQIKLGALLIVKLGETQQFQHAEHAIHRRSDFVAHGGQKSTLGPIGKVRRFLGRDQFSGAQLDALFKFLVNVFAAFFHQLTISDVAQERTEYPFVLDLHRGNG